MTATRLNPFIETEHDLVPEFMIEWKSATGASYSGRLYWRERHNQWMFSAADSDGNVVIDAIALTADVAGIPFATLLDWTAVFACAKVPDAEVDFLDLIDDSVVFMADAIEDRDSVTGQPSGSPAGWTY